jgi:transposase
LEPIGKQEKYLGKRVKRGLFRSSSGYLYGADINGSLNIGYW